MKNKVELIGTYGDDQSHALSAWTSTSRELTPDKEARIPALLQLLASEGHHTPFEKSSLHFLITTDIATHIHLLKHRVGISLNSQSARYKELKEDKCYLPVDWLPEEQQELLAFCELAQEKYHKTLAALIHRGVSRKRAKESARYYLPYASQLTADVMFNFRSFMHFIRLRYHMDAQIEVRHLAQKMLEAVHSTGQFNYSLKAFNLVKEGSLVDPTPSKVKA